MEPADPATLQRLVAAALDLFEERGYAGTTVADISERAGLGRRTFFRYFGDKREVLFSRTRELEELWMRAIREAPSPVDAHGVVRDALLATAGLLEGRRPDSGRRQRIIDANADLRERELLKGARLAGLVADGLQARGVPHARAVVAGELGSVALRVAYQRWAVSREELRLADALIDELAEMRALLTA